MGRKIPIGFSFLCGVFTGRKQAPPPPPIEDAAEKGEEDLPDSPGGGGGDPAGESPQAVLPPPPGGGGGKHMRTLSCQHTRSNSGVSKLVSSLSLRVGGSASVREEKGRHKEKKFKHEDSIWKKTIILGEKCRVPDENEEHTLYDEKGNKIHTYHPKTHSGMLTFSRQLSDNQDELSQK